VLRDPGAYLSIPSQGKQDQLKYHDGNARSEKCGTPSLSYARTGAGMKRWLQTTIVKGGPQMDYSIARIGYGMRHRVCA
jgi:hypothetical protein